MRNLCLLLTFLTLLGCSDKNEVKPDMTEFLVGTYELVSLNMMGEERNFHWVIEKGSDSTVNVRMSKFVTPFKGSKSMESDTTLTGIKVDNTHKLVFSYTKGSNDYFYLVDIEGTIYQGYLYIKSEYLKMEANYYGSEFKFKKL